MNQFNTDKNKGMLWNLMQNNGKFNQLPPKMDIKPIFEKHIQEIEVKGNINTSLVELNKQFISSFLGDINRFNNPESIRKNQTEMFNNNLQERENSFKQSMAQPLPPSVDFSDKEDTPISDIDSLLAKQMEKRKLDVPKLENQDTAAVQDWLNGSSNSMPNIVAPPIGDNSFGKNISIGETITNTDVQNEIIEIGKKRENVVIEKKVKWDDEVKPKLPDISELTKSNVESNSNISNSKELKTINEALIKVLKNQEYIINSIHDLQDRI